jgi:hypothetical protein
VPNSSYDVVLFGGLAVVLACLLQGKLNTLMVLVAGAAVGLNESLDVAQTETNRDMLRQTGSSR